MNSANKPSPYARLIERAGTPTKRKEQPGLEITWGPICRLRLMLQ